MKILFALSNLSCKYLLEASKQLSKKKNLKLAFYLPPTLSKDKEKNIIEFSKKNKSLIFDIRKVNGNNIDKKYLSYLDVVLQFNIWKCISVDRNYGRGYIQDLVGYESSFASNEEMLYSAINKAKYIERIIKKFKPKVVYWPSAVASYESIIFNLFCKHYNIQFIVAAPFRIKNFYYYALNMIDNSNPNLKKEYLKIKINNKDPLINKLFNEISLPGKLSSDTDYVARTLKKINSNIFVSTLVLVIFSIKHIIGYLMFKSNLKFFKLDFHLKYNLFSPIIEKFKVLSTLRYLKKFKYKDLNCNYIYYPLHRTPEGSTQLNGNTFMDQFFLIQSLSKNLPINYKLLIKEHPSMIQVLSRGYSFYEEVSKLPNVEILDYKLSGNEIVKKAKLVVILDGSSAIEAMLLGVPVLTMSKFIYDFLGMSVESLDFSKLNIDIVRAINLKKKLTKSYRTKKFKKLISLILDKGYNLREPDTFYYMKFNSSDESFRKTGEDVFQSLSKEFNIR